MKQISYLLVALLVTLLVTACGDSVTAEQHISEAQELIQENESNAALIELKNALQLNAEHTGARFLLGKIYLKLGEYAAAEKEFQSSLTFGGKKSDILPLLSQAQIRVGKAKAVLNMSIEGLSDAGKAMVLASQGLAKAQVGNISEALVLTGQAITLEPNSPYIRTANAEVLFKSGSTFDKARDQLKKAIDLDIQYAPAWSLLGDIEARERNFDKAIEAYSRSFSLQPSNFSGLNKRSLAHIYSKQLDKAQADLDILKKRFPRNPRISLSQGIVYWEIGKLEDAKASFEGALIAVDRFPQALLYLAQISNKQGDLDQAETYGEQFLSTNNNLKYGRLLLADIKYKRKKYEAAEKLLQPILDKNTDDIAVLNMLAQVQLKQNKLPSAVELLRRVSELKPNSVKAQVNLGAGLLAAGEEIEGFYVLEQSIALDEESSLADITRILGFIRLKQYDNALKAAEAFKSRKPESELPYVFMGVVYLAQKEEEAAERAFLKAKQLNPKNIQATLNLAAIAISRAKYSEAKVYYDEVLNHQPKHLGALLKLVGLARIEKNERQVVALLERAIELHPKSFLPRLQLSRHYMEKGEFEQISGLLGMLDANVKNRPEIVEIQVHQRLASREFSVAERLAKKLVDQRPQSATPLFLLAQAYSGLAESKKAEEVLRKALEIKPHYVPARVVLTRKLLREGSQRQLELHIKKLKRLAPGNEDVLQLEFSIARRFSSQKKALEMAEGLFKKYRSFNNMLMLARQKLDMGDQPMFVELHEAWLKEHPKSIKALISLAGYYQGSKDISKATEYYEKVLAAEPDSIIALNNLSWMLREQQPKKALVYAEKALKLAPEIASLMDTLALVYLSNGESVLAERMIERVIAKAPTDPTAKYHHAVILSGVGKKQQALKILDELLSQKVNFLERVEAEALRDKL